MITSTSLSRTAKTHGTRRWLYRKQIKECHGECSDFHGGVGGDGIYMKCVENITHRNNYFKDSASARRCRTPLDVLDRRQRVRHGGHGPLGEIELGEYFMAPWARGNYFHGDLTNGNYSWG